jgi:hypothetical protein
MSRRRDDRDHQLTELALELTRPRKPNPVVALYRWRYEVGAAVAVPVALVGLDRLVGPIWLLVVLAGLVSMVWHWPVARRFARARVRAVVVQHRLRTAFARARVCTLDGRRPAILWTTPRDREIRVLLACPAGVGVDRIRQQRRLLAAACFATEVDVARHPRFAHLVELTVRTAEPETEPDHNWPARLP